MSLTGYEGHPPVRVGSSIGDITAGLFTVIGIQAALFNRTISKKDPHRYFYARLSNCNSGKCNIPVL